MVKIEYINESLINGNATFNLQPVVSPVAINEIKEFEKSFLPFNKITDSILAQITNLNNAKEIAKLVTSSSKNISQATEDLNKQFIQEVGQFLENENVVNEFLKNNSQFTKKYGKTIFTSDKQDGFFICKLHKK